MTDEQRNANGKTSQLYGPFYPGPDLYRVVASEPVLNRIARLVQRERIGNRINMQDAEDICQEIVVALLDKGRSVFCSEGLPQAIVTTYAKRGIADFYRRRNAEKRDVRMTDSFDSANPKHERVQQALKRGDISYVNYLLHQYIDAVHVLPGVLRDTAIRHFLLGRTCEDIANEEGVSASTIRSRISRAREKISQTLPWR